MMIIGSIEQTA